MSNYWDLFTETGDISYYLLFKSTEKDALPENHETTEISGQQQSLM